MVFCNRRERLGSTLSEEIKKKEIYSHELGVGQWIEVH